jgi:hypothetical protein
MANDTAIYEDAVDLFGNAKISLDCVMTVSGLFEKMGSERLKPRRDSAALPWRVLKSRSIAQQDGISASGTGAQYP